LEDNHLSSLPGLKGLKKLKSLTLASNQFGELSAEIGDLSKLEFLDVHSNNLKALPSSVFLSNPFISAKKSNTTKADEIYSTKTTATKQLMKNVFYCHRYGSWEIWLF